MAQEQVVLITGATDGIGKAVALQLAQAGWHLLIHGRDEARLRATQRELGQRSGNSNIDWLLADFSSLAQTRRMAAFVADNYDRIDVLINNAATLQTERRVSAEGNELTLAVNHLAPFLLTCALLPVLQSTAAHVGQTRIVNVASNGHLSAKLDPSDLQFEQAYDGVTAYRRSKLANVLFTKALARRLAAAGVTANALHPGVITTKVLMAGFNMTGAPVDEGARPIVHLATSAELDGVTGKYFDVLRERIGVTATRDEALQDALWAASEALCGSA